MTIGELPITAFRSAILDAVRENSVVIVTAETGAGKSTQVPKMLLHAGYEVLVTEPRRLATRTVAARVAEECGVPLGDAVGFRTAYERCDSDATRCLFVTDGLALVRELVGASNHQVLVLDEVHEWNLNIEVLVAWTRLRIKQNPNFKLVLMSATLEANRLSEYFGGAPIISVPGRTFPVTELSPMGKTLEDDVVYLLRRGHNVLVFQPGKAEISATIARLRSCTDLNAEILPLHGDLTAEEQARCFENHSRPLCVVATNVAQTSVTIPCIDAVVDSGMERRVELMNSIEGLYLRSISRADSKQRMGRAGRTKPGIYIDWCTDAWADRPKFSVAEILRTRLDQTVLRLAETGFDIEELTFFHQPNRTEIQTAKQSLHALGCMDATGQVTHIGRLVVGMPVSVQYARMIVEATRLGVVDDVISIAAILEQGGITARVCSICKDVYELKTCECWKKLAPNERTSDVLAQLAVFKAANDIDRHDMPALGIFAKSYYQAKEMRRRLAASLKGKVRYSSTGNREDILKAVCAGMVDHLFVNTFGNYRNGDGIERQLVRESVAVVKYGGWIVGQPWDLQIPSRYGPRVLKLIRMASIVDPAWLAEVAPHLVEQVMGLQPFYDPEQDEVVSLTEIQFRGQKVASWAVLDPYHPQAPRLRREGRRTAGRPA